MICSDGLRWDYGGYGYGLDLVISDSVEGVPVMIGMMAKVPGLLGSCLQVVWVFGYWILADDRVKVQWVMDVRDSGCSTQWCIGVRVADKGSSFAEGISGGWLKW